MSSNYQFKIRIGALVFKDNKLLLSRQNNQPFWVFPGGTLEVGEGMIDCLVREMMEEASLVVTPGPLLYFGDFIKQPDSNPELPPEHKKARLRQSIDLFFLTHYQGGTLTMATDENINELDFYDLATVKTMQIQPSGVKQQLLTDWESGELLSMLSIPPSVTLKMPVYLGKYGI